jgi:DNA primase
MVRVHGADAIREAAARARPLLEYMVRRIVGRHELTSIEHRSAAVADALPVLEQLTDPVRRSEYAHLLADLTGVADASVLQALDRRLGGRPKEVAQTMKRGTARERMEREMLKLVARDADIFRTFVTRLGDDHFGNASHRRAFVALRDADGDVSSLVSGADERLSALIAQLAVEPLEGEATEEYAEGVWTRLQEFLLRSRSDALRLRLQKLDPTSDPGYEELFRELVAVDADLRRLREGVRDVV